MKKPITLISCLSLLAFLFFFQTNVSSCKKDTQIIRDTVTVIQKDTVIIKDTVPHINLQNGLIAYYPFTNNAADSSGNNNNGIVSGNLQYTSDANNHAGSAALFDGTSSYILVNDNGSLSPASLTISLQFYENSNAHQNLISKINNSDATSPVWGVSIFGGSPGSGHSTDAGWFIKGPATTCGLTDPVTIDELAFTSDVIATNKWYQLTCIFDQGIEKIYLNGVLKGALTKNFTIPKQCSQAPIEIGAFYQGVPYYFNGKMDEVRIYNRALNDREIQALAKGF